MHPWTFVLAILTALTLVACTGQTPAGPTTNISGDHNTVCNGGNSERDSACTTPPPPAPIVPVVIAPPAPPVS
jgi:hypothetical protein